MRQAEVMRLELSSHKERNLWHEDAINSRNAVHKRMEVRE